MFSSIIISGALAQDHEFIYPFYRLLEANSKLDVCLIGGKPVQGILGTSLPPNKNHPVKDIDQVKVSDYDLLVLPGGVKALEKTRQNKKLIKVKVWERGAGLTKACGTAACATAISGAILKLNEKCVDIEFTQGVLNIEWQNVNKIIMKGKVSEAKKIIVDI